MCLVLGVVLVVHFRAHFVLTLVGDGWWPQALVMVLVLALPFAAALVANISLSLSLALAAMGQRFRRSRRLVERKICVICVISDSQQANHSRQWFTAITLVFNICIAFTQALPLALAAYLAFTVTLAAGPCPGPGSSSAFRCYTGCKHLSISRSISRSISICPSSNSSHAGRGWRPGNGRKHQQQ